MVSAGAGDPHRATFGSHLARRGFREFVAANSLLPEPDIPDTFPPRLAGRSVAILSRINSNSLILCGTHACGARRVGLMLRPSCHLTTDACCAPVADLNWGRLPDRSIVRSLNHDCRIQNEMPGNCWLDGQRNTCSNHRLQPDRPYLCHLRRRVLRDRVPNYLLSVCTVLMEPIAGLPRRSLPHLTVPINPGRKAKIHCASAVSDARCHGHIWLQPRQKRRRRIRQRHCRTMTSFGWLLNNRHCAKETGPQRLGNCVPMVVSLSSRWER